MTRGASPAASASAFASGHVMRSPDAAEASRRGYALQYEGTQLCAIISGEMVL